MAELEAFVGAVGHLIGGNDARMNPPNPELMMLYQGFDDAYGQSGEGVPGHPGHGHEFHNEHGRELRRVQGSRKLRVSKDPRRQSRTDDDVQTFRRQPSVSWAAPGDDNAGDGADDDLISTTRPAPPSTSMSRLPTLLQVGSNPAHVAPPNPLPETKHTTNANTRHKPHHRNPVPVKQVSNPLTIDADLPSPTPSPQGIDSAHAAAYPPRRTSPKRDDSAAGSRSRRDELEKRGWDAVRANGYPPRAEGAEMPPPRGDGSRIPPSPPSRTVLPKATGAQGAELSSGDRVTARGDLSQRPRRRRNAVGDAEPSSSVLDGHSPLPSGAAAGADSSPQQTQSRDRPSRDFVASNRFSWEFVAPVNRPLVSGSVELENAGTITILGLLAAAGSGNRAGEGGFDRGVWDGE